MPVVTHFPRIKLLPDSVANQIAAGEVIERPASVLKELIENSIDAAATKIHIDIEQSGTSLIRIRDNGQGIHKDDLKLALQAHATSKLNKLSDLSQIVSLGFRGEAIPSIASVSRFKMISKLHEAGTAWSIDNTLNIKPAAHETGTTVEVNDLFYSTPGRRKFLKSDRTEFLHIQSLLRAIALSHFSVGLFIKHNDLSIFQLPACQDNFDQRVLNICGKTFLNNSITLDIEKEGMRLWGWLGMEDVARSQSDRQYFFVNGRIVRDKHVNHAIRLAYSDRMAVGRYPSYVLHFQVDPAAVDINVHPAKHEVRFAEARNVHDFIYSSLMEIFNKSVVYSESEVINEQTENKIRSEINEEVSIYTNKEQLQTTLELTKNLSVNYLNLSNGEFIVAVINNVQYLIDVTKAKIFFVTNYLIVHYQTNSITQQPVLVPLTFELNNSQINMVQEHSELISRWGFELEQIAPTQISIRALPSRLVYADAKNLVMDLLSGLMKKSADEELATKLACHVNDSGVLIDGESVKHLLNDINNFDNHDKENNILPWRKLDKPSLLSLLSKK